MRGVVKQSLAVGRPKHTVTISRVYDGPVYTITRGYSEDGTEGTHYRQRFKDSDVKSTDLRLVPSSVPRSIRLGPHQTVARYKRDERE
jgi:hypothetical protein